MVYHPPETQSADRSQPDRTEQLRRISEQLATVLESLELEAEPQLADELITAFRTADRAFELEDKAAMERVDGGVFRFDSTAARD